MADAARPMPNPGISPDAIAGYRILRVLGQGGMATVYAAQQEHPKRTVAIKVMRPHIAAPHMPNGPASGLRRFRKEIDLLAKLSHPCIAQIYAAGTVQVGDSELPYFVMEYIPSAQTILEFAEEKQLERSTRLKLFVQVCAAIDHGHRQRVLHLDLKPGNVLVDREGHVKVIDFGVARAVEQTAPDVTSETKDTSILGSLHAMSPEQIDPAGRDLDARSDVYSLGVLLYRLLLGVMPYELSGKSIIAAARTICETQPRKPRSIDAGISPVLEAVMLRALEKDPALRFRHAGEFGKAIAAAEARRYEGTDAHREGSAAPPAVRASTENAANASGKWVAIVTGVLLIAALIFTFSMLQRDRESNVVPQERHQAPREELGSRVSPFTARPGQARPAYLLAHSGMVSSLSMSADGTRLASASHDGTVRLWDLENQKLLHTLSSHEEPIVECVALNADSTLVASGARSGLVVIEDALHGNIEHKITLRTGPVRFLVFGPSGELAGASDDLTARIWNADFRLRSTLRSTTGAFIVGSFNADGSRFATASTGGRVLVWDTSTAKDIAREDVGDDVVHALAFGVDGAALTVLTASGTAVTFKPDTRERLFRFAVAGDTPTAVALDEHGEHVFVARQDRSVEIWNIATGEQVIEPLEIARPAVRMVYSNASNRLVMGSADGAIEVRQVIIEN